MDRQDLGRHLTLSHHDSSKAQNPKAELTRALSDHSIDNVDKRARPMVLYLEPSQHPGYAIYAA
jgi:hypothetical protein